MHELCNNNDNSLASKHKRRTRLQCLWTLPQTPQCVKANSFEEREHSDEESETVDKVKEETFRHRRIFSAGHRRPFLRVRGGHGHGRDERPPVDQPDGQLLPRPARHDRLPVHELLQHVRRASKPSPKPLPPLPWLPLPVFLGSKKISRKFSSRCLSSRIE